MTTNNKFNIYNASAGSGKTYTLVREYLLLLLKAGNTEAYRNILAITFTNKAVAEMKSRIIESLHGLSATQTPAGYRGLMEDLSRKTGYSEEQLRSTSSRILKSILHNYAAFDVSTIDRFTFKVIKAFATELEIPSNFEVELQTKRVLQEAVDRLIDRAGQNKELTRVLLSYTFSKTDEDKSWDISKDLYRFSGLLVQENHQPYVQLLKGRAPEDFRELASQTEKALSQTEEQLKQSAETFFEILEKNGLEKNDFSGGYLCNYFHKLKEQEFSEKFESQWHQTLADKPLYPKRVKKDKQDLLDRLQNGIVRLYEITRNLFFQREYLKEISVSIIPLSLLSAVSAELEKIKEERALVLISDFNAIIAAEIKDQPTPFIYEHLGERYDNYFIDEFQDTSEVQWNNLVPLIDHALSTEFTAGQSAGLTLVGDAKQSIYRFRGGKAEQFIKLYNGQSPFSIKPEVISLPDNYRSAREIVNFNNSLFGYVSEKLNNPLYRDLFASSAQNPKKISSGYVNITFLEAANRAEEDILHPEKVLEIILDLEKKGVPKSDICILTRTGKQGLTIASYLSEKGISIISSESLLISNSPEVEFMVSLMEFSQNTRDKHLKWNILGYLSEKRELEDPHQCLLQNLHRDGQDLFSWLKEYNIDFRLHLLRSLPLYQAAEYVIDTFKLVSDSDAYVQFFLDYIFEKTKNSETGIPAFLEQWEQDKEKLSIVAPKTKDAVQIMTIHKSKGLEFPVVIYPFANTTLNDLKKEHLWLPLPESLSSVPVGYFRTKSGMLNWGETEAAAYQQVLDQVIFDNMNVLYVAFTRASQQLYILSNKESGGADPKENKVSGLLSGFLRSLSLWSDEKVYEFGTPEYTGHNTEKEVKAIPQHSQYASLQNSKSLQLVTRAGILWGSQQQEAIEKGVLMHKALSLIKTSGDLKVSLQRIATEETLSPDTLDKLEEQLRLVITHPSLAPYFSDKATAYLERDIISPNGEILRPDRLNFEDKTVSIIDYKTGEINASHYSQMEQYANLLRNMGFTVKSKLLVHINDPVNVLFA